MRRLILLVWVWATVALAGSFVDSPQKREARMEWWKDAKFGMFIHWGAYSQAGGEWEGTTDHGEWLQFTAKIPLAEYQAFARTFNPVRFDADEWVKTARDAGMKYLVITAKHHDGFAMFDSPREQSEELPTMIRELLPDPM